MLSMKEAQIIKEFLEYRRCSSTNMAMAKLVDTEYPSIGQCYSEPFVSLNG